MIHASTYGKGRNALAEALFTRQPFKTGGALSGEVWEYSTVSSWDLGQLNDVEQGHFIRDLRDHGITYVVWSYQTPIAWVRGDGGVYRVEQRFSPTTSKHQGMLYMMTHDARR